MKASLSHLLIVTGSLICFTLLHADNENPSLETEAAPLADAQKQNPPMQKMPSREKSCKMANNPHRIDIKHIEAKGIGYNTGYTSLDAFFTSLFWENYVPFFDARAHIFNDGRWAANAGIGARYIFDPCQWMVGGNVYYDYRGTKHGNYNQISAGLEAFYDRYEAHLNGYLPVGLKRNLTKSHIESVTFKGFSGNYILQNENYNNSYEGAMKGFNAELGMHLAGNRMQYDLYFGVGPYYYDVSSGKHAWGGKARLKAEITKYLFLELSDSYDRIFHNRVQGTVNVSIPFGGKICYPQKRASSCHNVMDWQAALPVERQEIIVVSKFKKDKTIDPVAIDPVTGQPFFVVFVNNTNPNLGTGTFENPFQNLTNNDNPISAENFSTDRNIIYVFAGDGSPTHMSGGNMFLSDYQRLLGSANSHPFQTTKGLLTIPALTALVPHVQGVATGGTAGSIINLANYCEVSGLNLAFPTFASPSHNFACISGVPSVGPLINANINNNVLTNETWGVVLGQQFLPTIATGTLIIENNTASGQANAGAPNPNQGFSYFVRGSQNATISCVNNIAHDNGAGATGLFLRTYGNDIATITGNTFERVQAGMVFTDDGTLGQSNLFRIEGNSVNNTVGEAFTINVQTTTPDITTYIIENNVFINEIGQSQILNNTINTLCIRFNNNKGYPSQSGGNPYLIFNPVGTGTINLEPPQNNYPQPAISGPITSVPACSCGLPCN